MCEARETGLGVHVHECPVIHSDSLYPVFSSLRYLGTPGLLSISTFSGTHGSRWDLANVNIWTLESAIKGSKKTLSFVKKRLFILTMFFFPLFIHLVLYRCKIQLFCWFKTEYENPQAQLSGSSPSSLQSMTIYWETSAGKFLPDTSSN